MAKLLGPNEGGLRLEKWVLPNGRLVPVVQARITLVPGPSCGLRGLTAGNTDRNIVMEPQRLAAQSGRAPTENYLGIMFVGGPDELAPGESAEVRLALMYFPEETLPRRPAGSDLQHTGRLAGCGFRDYLVTPAANRMSKLPATGKCP